MIVNETRHIGGEIVGLGIVRTDGTEDFRWLDKPIHNRITSAGLDHMLCYAGLERQNSNQGNTAVADCTRLYMHGGGYDAGKYRIGILGYCRIGTGGKPTEFTDTDLVNPVTEYSSTLKTGNPFCGTKVTSASDYRIRVTHISNAVTSDCIIKEFGIYGRYTMVDNTLVYPMFARIALDKGVSLNSGEKLMVTYELHVTHSNELVHVSNFFDMLDSSGNPLQCDIKPYFSTAKASSDFAGTLSQCPYVGTSGGESIHDAYNSYFYSFPAYFYNQTTRYGDLDTLGYSTTPKDFSVANASLSKARTDPGEYTFLQADYTGVGTNDKHRDLIVTLGAYNPNMAEPTDYQDIYFLRYRGLDIKFGYTDDEGVFIPQALRKWASQNMIFTFRTRYVTPDTIQADGSDPSEAGE